MNENLNLCKILKDCPIGTKFRSSVYGDVYLERVTSSDASISLRVFDGGVVEFKSNGRLYNVEEGECLVFPSKDQRDWNKFELPVERFDPKNFKPFDKVLMRQFGDCTTWVAEFFGGFPDKATRRVNVKGIGENPTYYQRCIPYNDETKHLVGTQDDCPDYYKWWEE